MGRACSSTKLGVFFAKYSLLPMIISSAILVIFYFTDLNEKVAWLGFIVMLMMGFNMFRNSCTATFFNLRCTMKASKEDKEAIGVLNANSSMIGMGLGNLISIFLPLIKNMFR